MNDCIFCKIAQGQIPCKKIYEDDTLMAYLDINPDSNGHTLVIPKKHYKDIFDIPNDIHSKIYETSLKIMKQIEEKLNCDGFSLVQNNGSIQEVKHFHLHIKPYYKNQQLTSIVKDKSKLEDINVIYEKLKNID